MIIATPPYLDLAPVPGPVLSKHMRSILIAFNLHTPPPPFLQCSCTEPHFAEGETEAQEGPSLA